MMFKMFRRTVELPVDLSVPAAAPPEAELPRDVRGQPRPGCALCLCAVANRVVASVGGVRVVC